MVADMLMAQYQYGRRIICHSEVGRLSLLNLDRVKQFPMLALAAKNRQR